MARGLQKAESQAKSQAATAKKAGGNSSLKKDKGLKYQCVAIVKRFLLTFRIEVPQISCRQDIHNISDMKIHWASKHPKLPEQTDEFASMQKAAPATGGK